MNAKRHAHLARLLIEACGGLKVAAGLCRVRMSMLSKYCDENSGCFMPADVIADLEAGADPLYSRALTDACAGPKSVQDLLSEIFKTQEAAAFLQIVGRAALEDGVISPEERRAIEGVLSALEHQALKVRAAHDLAPS